MNFAHGSGWRLPQDVADAAHGVDEAGLGLRLGLAAQVADVDLEDVWGYDFPTSANSLEVYVGYLRRKTEAEGEPRLIQTVRGVGYVLKEA